MKPDVGTSESQTSHSPGPSAEPWIALALSAAVVIAWTVEQLVPKPPAPGPAFAPVWLPLAAAGLAAAGVAPWKGRGWLRLRRAALWAGLLLMIWAANGLPLDLLRLSPLMPFPVDWAGLARKVLALAASILLARLALARPAAAPPGRAPTWYGYVAFVLALPYPVLRTVWAMGGTLGLDRPGAAGRGWLPWLICIPWLLAAALSLLLVPTWRRAPRRLLLIAGWTATAIVSTIGPAASWSFFSALAAGSFGRSIAGIATWVFGLFYGSWFLWAIAAAAATRSYQLRSAAR